MSKPNLAKIMSKAGKERVRLVKEILQRYGLGDVPFVMDTTSITIGTLDLPKDCEKELQVLGFLVMKMHFGYGRIPE